MKNNYDDKIKEFVKLSDSYSINKDDFLNDMKIHWKKVTEFEWCNQKDIPIHVNIKIKGKILFRICYCK